MKLEIRSKSAAADGMKQGAGDWNRYLSAFSSMLRSSVKTHTPFFLAHAMTFGCNSRCKSCTYWKNTYRMNEDMSTEDVYRLLDEAYDAGMRGYYMFGGEPLIRRDIGKITDYAKRKGFITVMNTNGSLLEKKAAELKNLDFAFVSIDYHNDYDDVIRGRPGTFNEVINGLKALKRSSRTWIAFVTTISRMNWDTIEPMAKLAQDLGIGISYNSIEQSLDFGLTTEETTPNFSVGLSDEKLHEFYRKLQEIKAAGYPLMETDIVLRDFVNQVPWKCHFPKMFVYVTPDKQIYNCDYTYAYDLRKGSFGDYFSSEPFKAYVKQAESCNSCVRTCVRGYSYTYKLVPKQILGLAGQGRILFNRETDDIRRKRPRRTAHPESVS